ncbi:hypothetical protein [Nocardioides terrisoli]|uniref:hypothetical protein n=1 Tax=Nocardioides terrisoli TaxID=3388267 RepID=UPI00287B8037|nr:hypothetical protein [Nocardioides marmorisolisilvae]
MFIHLPKTAGTSLVSGLVEALDPAAAFIGVDRSGFGSFRDFATMHAIPTARVILAPDQLPAAADLVAGHFSPSTTRARYPTSPHFTVLRSPRARLLSTWLFSRAHTELTLRHWGPYGDWIRRARSRLAEYLADPSVAAHTDNAMTRMLLWPHALIPDADFIDPAHDNELVEAILGALEGFDYVGLVEDPEMLANLSTWLGTTIPSRRLNEARGMPRRLRPDVDAEVDEAGSLLWARSRVDQRVWEAVAGRVLPATSDLRDLEAQVFDRAVARQRQAVASPVAVSRRALDAAYTVRARLAGR